MHHIRFKSIPTDKVAIHPLFEMEHYDDDNGTQWFCPKRVKGSNRCRGRWHSNGHNRSQARTDHPNKRGGLWSTGPIEDRDCARSGTTLLSPTIHSLCLITPTTVKQGEFLPSHGCRGTPSIPQGSRWEACCSQNRIDGNDQQGHSDRCPTESID